MKKLCCLILAAALLLTLGACGKKNAEPELVYVDEGTQETERKPRQDTAILYTAGMAGRDAGFPAAVQSARDESTYEYLNGYVGLVDLGGALDVQGGETALYTRLDVMNYMGYEAAALAPADCAAGAETLITAANAALFPILCGDLVMAGTDTTPLSAWTLAYYGELCVAYVGVLVPEEVDASLLAAEGVSYELTDCAGAVNKAADTARAAGADYVVALVSCGAEAAEALLAESHGVDVLLDGAGDGGASRTMQNAMGGEVLYSGLDPAVDSIGRLVIAADGALSAEIITTLPARDSGMLGYLASLGYEVETETESTSEGTEELTGETAE